MIEQHTDISGTERVQDAMALAVVRRASWEKVGLREALAHMFISEPFRSLGGEYNQQEMEHVRAGLCEKVPHDTAIDIYSELHDALEKGEETIIRLDGRETEVLVQNRSGIEEVVGKERLRTRLLTHGKKAEEEFRREYSHAVFEGVEEVLTTLFYKNTMRKLQTRIMRDHLEGTSAIDGITVTREESGKIVGYDVPTDIAGITVHVRFDISGQPVRYASVQRP